MIEDLDYLPSGSTRDCDLCIVGSGAAGLAVATELCTAERRIIVLESGAMRFEEPTQHLYDCSVTGLRHVGHAEGRFRTYGGSTTRWGGQSLPLTASDFERRAWVPNSGWPFGADELTRYYDRASRFLLTDTLNFDTDIFRLLGFVPPQFRRELVQYHFSKWSPRPSLRRIYGPRLARAKNVTLIFHANLTRVDVDVAGSSVEKIEVRSLSGNHLVLRPKQLVLCTGGIETARILLANDHQQPGGIGNARGLVGRFFQDHPTAFLGRVETDRPGELQRLFHTFYRRRRKYSPRLSLSSEAQQRHGVLNASSVIQFDAARESGYVAMKQAVGEILQRRGTLASLKQIARSAVDVRDLARPVYEYLVRGRGFTPNPTVSLSILTEQEPNPNSRITLGDQTDALGIRKVNVHWELTELTRRTVAVFGRILQTEFLRVGAGRLKLAEWLALDASDWQNHFGDLNHHMGTTRMARAPEVGVVDSTCRVHGLSNLWVASSAVFPTGGHSNPTLTILALAARLADELKPRI